MDAFLDTRDARPAGVTPPHMLRAAALACLALAACGRSTLSSEPLGNDGGATPLDGTVPADGGGDAEADAGCAARVGPIQGTGEGPAGELITEGSTREGSRILRGRCGGLGPEQVVTWISPVDGLVFFDTFGSSFDTVLYEVSEDVLVSCAPQLSSQACSDDAPGAVFESEISRFVSEGEEVHLVVDSFDRGGDFVLNVRYSLFPIERNCDDGRDDDGDGRVDCNDADCDGRMVCQGGGRCDSLDAGSDLGRDLIRSSTRGEGNDFTASCGGTRAPDEVVLWTAPFSGRFVIDTRGSSYDTLLYAAETDDGCTPSRELQCNDDRTNEEGDLTSALTLNLEGGQQLALVVDGYDREAGEYVLSIQGVPDQENCDNGVDDNGDGRVDCRDTTCISNPVCEATCPALEANTLGRTEGSTAGGPNRFSSTCGGGSAPELTLSWTAPHDGGFRFDTVDSSFDTVLSVYEGDAQSCSRPDLSLLTCNDDSQDLWSEVEIEATDGETYLLVVDGWSSAASGDVVLNVTDLDPPASETDCDDGFDNDQDGDTDCDDADCDQDPACETPDSETDCENGVDDDMDGDVDCDDPDCDQDPACEIPDSETDCENGVDDDMDGDVDCDDADCDQDPACEIPDSETDCENGIDDDMDGDVDCDDADCDQDPACQPPPACYDDDLGTTTGLRVSRGSTVGASNDAGGSCGGGSAPEVVLRWTAPDDGNYQFDTFGSQYDTLLYIWEATPTCQPIELACDDDSRQGLQSLVTGSLNAGDAVYVVVDGYGTNQGNYNLNIRSVDPPPTTEQDCFDGSDEDNDGLTDCADPDCAADCTF